MGVIRNCCPNCGGKIEISSLQQYSLNYTILKSGKISKRYYKRDEGPMEVMIVSCVNEECLTNWGEGEFMIDAQGRFVDEKFDEE